ncbi:hypothetical protein LTR37_003924 [Vermiconidia calcicola]|uniref:Uncharacterized protein n=1 Tax=Vermiconidia calcicola TaxID=1690605 RepID=A0ACC3NQ20_9PEZI|nr:hypothetical protein LTR37_003924 [Vermiconidia calcicola]
MAETNSLPALLALPEELIQHVLVYLEPIDLASIARACKRLHEHSYDDRIWQPLVNRNIPTPIGQPKPLKSFRELYSAHHPHWFLPRHRIWFSDSEPSGKLVICRYDPQQGSIVGHAVVATRGHHTLHFWEKNREVVIHSFNPQVSLDLDRPVLRLDVDSARTNDQPDNHPSDRGYAPPSRFDQEILMDTFVEAGLYSSFMLCRTLPAAAISQGTSVWPPLRFFANSRTRGVSRDGFNSSGHRPSRLSEVSENNFRIRKWVEYAGRRSSPTLLSFTSPNGLSAALGLAGPYFAAGMATSNGGRMSIRMPEDITTYSTLPESCYTPTPDKPWQGIWCGDYSGHGCEFIVIQQPDKEDEKPLPHGMDWLRQWLREGRRGSSSSESSYASAQEEVDYAEATGERLSVSELDDDIGESSSTRFSSEAVQEDTEEPRQSERQGVTDYKNAPSGRLEAIKLTGDPNIPRGEYTFIAPDIGCGGFVRIADEQIFLGARVVRSAGHIAARGFQGDSYTPSQLIMISHDTLAQFWEDFGHISYYKRVDLEALMRFTVLRQTSSSQLRERLPSETSE